VRSTFVPCLERINAVHSGPYVKKIFSDTRTAVIFAQLLSCLTYIQGVSGGIVNILGGGSMDFSK
jgi:hypothetical protein